MGFDTIVRAMLLKMAERALERAADEVERQLFGQPTDKEIADSIRKSLLQIAQTAQRLEKYTK